MARGVRERLADPEGQSQGWLRKHMGKRHSLVRFQTKGEHLADHRLHQPYLDHYHDHNE
jgi:hypothetical protein